MFGLGVAIKINKKKKKNSIFMNKQNKIKIDNKIKN